MLTTFFLQLRLEDLPRPLRMQSGQIRCGENLALFSHNSDWSITDLQKESKTLHSKQLINLESQQQCLSLRFSC